MGTHAITACNLTCEKPWDPAYKMHKPSLQAATDICQLDI